MNIIPLKSNGITFNEFSITYSVDLPKEFKGVLNHIPFCSNDITQKELILLPTLLTREKLIVNFACSNVFPSFYQAIYESNLYDVDEYRTEINNIYQIGDIVGYIML